MIAKDITFYIEISCNLMISNEKLRQKVERQKELTTTEKKSC